jgi:hypothetical protein
MTMEQLAADDEIAAARLEWLDAEAQLAELLAAGSVKSATTAAGADVADFTAAIHRSEQAHTAYMQVIRRRAGLADF